MKRRPSLLIVDDEGNFRQIVREGFEKGGWVVEEAGSATEALEKLYHGAFDVVFWDMTLPGMNGLVMLRLVKEKGLSPLVVITADRASEESALEAAKAGAVEFLLKPVTLDLLEPLLARLGHLKALADENALHREEMPGGMGFENLGGCSPAMQRLIAMIPNAARSDSPVLITGEPGTGKERLARIIHGQSLRAHGPFVAVRCGALWEGFPESDRFGQETDRLGGTASHKGRLERCDGGTLFLNGVEDLSPTMQADVLRILEEKGVYHLGGQKPVSLDLRVIAATNRDLEKLVRRGRFRPELFYRLNVISIHIPPLRERREDIPALARHFLHQFAQEMNKAVGDLSPEAVEFLMSYPWPGNVRELRNAVERAVMRAAKRHIRAEDFSFLTAPLGIWARVDLPLADVERRHIENVLAHLEGNVSRAARVLGVHRSTLHKKVQEYGITWKRGRGRPRNKTLQVQGGGS